MGAANQSSAGKGRPTPSRKEQQAARKQPVIPVDRKAAGKVSREKQRADRQASYEGLRRGDEKHLPARDQGRQRRFVREYVDARRNLAEFFLPVAFALMILNVALVQFGEAAALGVLGLLYALLFAAIIDAALMWMNLRKVLTEKFGVVEKGTIMYAIMRAFQIRRTRLPRPVHDKHGHYPA